MIQEHQPHGDSHLASLARNESEFNLHWQDPERTVGSCALPVLNRFSVAMSLGMEKPRVEALSKARHGQGLLRANFGRVCNFPGNHRDFVTNMFYSLGSLIRKFRSRGSLFKNDGPSFFEAI